MVPGCRYVGYIFFLLFSICVVDSTVMTTFLFTAVWRWECMSDRLLPRKQDAPGVFASIILFLTRRPYSAAVVRFSNSRRMRGAGRKKSLLQLVRMPTVCMSFQRALFYVRDVWLFLCRRHLARRNATPAQRCCHPEYRWRICPCALSLKCVLT